MSADDDRTHHNPMPWGQPPYACEHIAALEARIRGEAWARKALHEIERRINRRRR